MNKSHYETLMADAEFRKAMASESLVEEAAELISRLMHEQKLSKADLARKLCKSRAWVTQLLDGTANMTVRTLADVAFALGAEVKLTANLPEWGQSAKMQPARAQTKLYTVKPSKGQMNDPFGDTPSDDETPAEWAA